MKSDISRWDKEAQHISSVNAELADILAAVVKDQSAINKTVIKAELNFGDVILSNGTLLLPDWAKENISFGVVLDHSLEVFTNDKAGTSPVAVLEPGQSFVLIDHPDLTLLPLPLLNISAGARSIFLLPKITEASRFFRLAKAYNLRETDPPKNLTGHWQIFTEIAKKASSPWKATVLFFDKSWLQCDSFNGARLYQYLRRTNLPSASFFRKKLSFEIAFAETLNELRFKPDPFLIEHIQHLFAMSCHFIPGFVFAEDERLAPVRLLQEAFINDYGLHYVPSILQPGYAQKGRPCYHSMQHPMFLHSTPRKHETNLEQLREIYRVIHKTVQHIEAIDPISNELFEFIHTELEFFHTSGTQKKYREVTPSRNIELIDPVIKKQVSEFHVPFSDAGAFLKKGCIAMNMS